MRFGIVSDVHANVQALERSLAHLDAVGFDKLIFLGDAVGYGGSPNEVCDLLRERVSAGVLGNHDAAVVGRMPFEDYYDAAKRAILWTRDVLTKENFEWLAELPYTARVDDILHLSHGAPDEPEAFRYVFYPSDVTPLQRQFESWPGLSLVGHSHLTITYSYDAESTELIRGDRFSLDPTKKYIVTAGSVGQPRDRDARSCCCVFDSETGIFDFHRVDYDISQAQKCIADAGLATVFAERLAVGM